MLLSSIDSFAQRRSQQYVNYINKYKNLAISQMYEYGIPASITLAQGLLESGAGSSELATKGNNHFGIKCGSSWTGPTMAHDDDRRNDCFRVYKSVEQSYIDHAVFLQRSRYRSLFRLDRKDYKGWARGLKACGYATSSTYAQKLINIIELYELAIYDSAPMPTVSPVIDDTPSLAAQPVIEEPVTAIVYANGIPYAIAGRGETLDAISKKYGISVRKLRKYNELSKTAEISAGDIVYLAKKKTKASREFRKNCWHKVTIGQSMYDVAQMYGIRLKYLYKRNFKDLDYIPKAGDLLKVR